MEGRWPGYLRLDRWNEQRLQHRQGARHTGNSGYARETETTQGIDIQGFYIVAFNLGVSVNLQILENSRYARETETSHSRYRK